MELCSTGQDKRVMHIGECFVLDVVNPEWHWRGEGCRFAVLDSDQMTECLTSTTILVNGDSFSSKCFHNIDSYANQAIESLP